MTPRIGEKWDVSPLKSVSSIVKCVGFHVDNMKLGWAEESYDTEWDVLGENCVSKVLRVLASGLQGYRPTPALFMTPEELNQLLIKNDQYNCVALNENEIQSFNATINELSKLHDIEL